ncbi:unnamed protein product, partial [Ectocarpus sp. 8 AP-2014]
AASAQRWTLPQSSVNRRDQTRSNLRNRPRRSARSRSESALPTRRAHRYQQTRSTNTEPRRPNSRNRWPKGDIRINGRGSKPTVPRSSRARTKNTKTAPNASVTSSTTPDDESAAPPPS